MARYVNPHNESIGCIIPDWLMPRREVSLGAKVLYAKLAQHGRSGECYPGQETLAFELDLSPRQVRNLLQELIDHALVEVRRSGAGRTNRYLFPWHPWMGDAPTPSRPRRSPRPTRHPRHSRRAEADFRSEPEVDCRSRAETDCRSLSKDEGISLRHVAARPDAAADADARETTKTPEQVSAARLEDLGVDPPVARRCAATNSPDKVNAVVERAKRRGDDPPSYAVAALTATDPKLEARTRVAAQRGLHPPSSPPRMRPAFRKVPS